MKTLLKVLSAVALTGVMVLPVLADDATTSTDAKDVKDLKKVIENEGINYVETAQKGITLSGYVDTSYTEQFGGRGTGFGGDQSLLHQFDRNNNNFNINAVKIALEKALPDKNEWAAGFRIDTIYGSDAQALNAASGGNGSVSATSPGGVTSSGSSASDFYLEQALVKFRIPVGNGLDIYAGKFVTFLGYEVIESPANLNFSRGLLFTNAIPQTHTGVYADYKFNDTVEVKLGVVDGINASISNPTPGGQTDAANDYPFGGKAITGQINITAPGKNANIAQSFYYAPSGGGVGDNVENGTVFIYDIWGNWNPTFVKDSALTLGFNIDFGYNGQDGHPDYLQATNNGGITPTPGPSDLGLNGSQTWWGGALYASYKVNKVLTLSARGEYLHASSAYNPLFGANGLTADGGTIALATPSQDDWSGTLTASFAIWDNLLTRVEYRADVLSAGSGPTTTTAAGNTILNGSSVQNEISLEAVYSF
jgi:hypothetical protein